MYSLYEILHIHGSYIGSRYLLSAVPIENTRIRDCETLTMRFHASLLCATALPSLLHAFPNAPFHTQDRWIVDSNGANFTYVGANWPGAGEVMIPEGLQYQSIASIVSKIKSLKMNHVRLTFAIEMIDDIKDRGGDVTIQKSFQKALGSNGDAVYQNVIKNNPQFGASTTRLQVRCEY
jgi:hypothetical protein